MKPHDLIEKYYTKGSRAHRVLVEHCRQVAELAGEIARKLADVVEADPDFVVQAAWLHDIGIFLTDAPDLGCHGDEPYIRHGLLGAEILMAQGLDRHALVCERHIGVGLAASDIRTQGLPLPERDMLPQTIEEEIVAYADLFFSKHRNGRRSAGEVRRSLGRFGLEKVARFDLWNERFHG